MTVNTVWTQQKGVGYWHLVAQTHGFYVESLCGERFRRGAETSNPHAGQCPVCTRISGEPICDCDSCRNWRAYQ